MSLVDPISDMLTRIRNAYMVGHDEVRFPASKIKAAILGILKENGYIEDFKVEGREAAVTLKYENTKPVISKIERVSTPGRRFYVKKDEIPTVLSGRGIAIISTSKGLMTGDDAKRENLGGEIICKLYQENNYPTNQQICGGPGEKYVKNWKITNRSKRRRDRNY